MLGEVVKYVFIAFNAVLVCWIVYYTYNIIATADPGAAQTGGALGMMLGWLFILSLWLSGNMILGLFLMRKDVASKKNLDPKIGQTAVLMVCLLMVFWQSWFL